MIVTKTFPLNASWAVSTRNPVRLLVGSAAADESKCLEKEADDATQDKSFPHGCEEA
jgi:hypothetical protein